MKKSLFALAATTAFAGAAQAQSSVTIYGILDAGYIGSSVQGLATTAGTNAATTKSTVNMIGQSAESTSRLGFKGTEDLGGGTSAFFTVEVGLMPSTSGTSTANVSTMNNRQSFVGLKKNGIGQFAVGTQYTPVFNSGSATSTGQFNNVTGDLIYATNALASGNQPAALSPFSSTTGATTQPSSSSSAFTARTASTVSFKTDTFAGFSASGVVVANNANTTWNGNTYSGTVNNSGWGLSADYTWNKLYATAAYQQLKDQTRSVSTVSIWDAALGGINTADNQFLGGATYDFGIIKAYAQYVNRKVTSTLDSAVYASRTAQQLGVRSMLTPKVEAWASAGNGRLTTWGSGIPTANFVGYQVGANYLLSKRTNLYSIFGHTQTSSTSVATGLYTSQYAVGVRHTF